MPWDGPDCVFGLGFQLVNPSAEWGAVQMPDQLSVKFTNAERQEKEVRRAQAEKEERERHEERRKNQERFALPLHRYGCQECVWDVLSAAEQGRVLAGLRECVV